MKIDVLYEDNHLLIVYKPPNIPVQADASGDDDLLYILKKYIKDNYNKPGDVYLGLVHRLDRPVGGVMVFARTSKAAARLSEAIRTGAFRKHYRAVVRGSAQNSGRLEDFLIKDEALNTSRVVPDGTPHAKRAVLAYSTLTRRDGLSLLDIELFTGRHHQIRVQLAHAGYPIWGDARYGGGKPGQQIALQAYHVVFPHPVKRNDVDIVLTDGLLLTL